VDDRAPRETCICCGTPVEVDSFDECFWGACAPYCDECEVFALEWVECWVDADGDGHSAGLPERHCGGCSFGYIEQPPSDCYDSGTDPVAADVYPGQMWFFDAPYHAPEGSSFDFDCDGLESAQVPDPTTCESMPDYCRVGDGWVGPVPTCGESGTFGRCFGADTCFLETGEAVQRCR
jgi:hypothetical protein